MRLEAQIQISEEGKVQEFYGAPSPKDIALAAFGTERTNYLEMDDKLKKNTIERILCCIIDRSKLPYDIVNAVYANVCTPRIIKTPIPGEKYSVSAAPC